MNSSNSEITATRSQSLTTTTSGVTKWILYLSNGQKRVIDAKEYAAIVTAPAQLVTLRNGEIVNKAHIVNIWQYRHKEDAYIPLWARDLKLRDLNFQVVKR